MPQNAKRGNGAGNATQSLPCPYCSPFNCVHSAEEQRNILFEETDFTQDPDIAFTISRGPNTIYRTMQGCVNGHAKIKRVSLREPDDPASESLALSSAEKTNMNIARTTSLSWRPKMIPTAAEKEEVKRMQRLAELKLDSTISSNAMKTTFGVADTESFIQFLNLCDEQRTMSKEKFKKSGKLRELQRLGEQIKQQGNRAIYPKGPIERWGIHQQIEGSEREDLTDKGLKRLAESLQMKKEGVSAIRNMAKTRRDEFENIVRRRAELQESKSLAASQNSSSEESSSEVQKLSFGEGISDDGSSAEQGEIMRALSSILPEREGATKDDNDDDEETGESTIARDKEAEIQETIAKIHEEANRELFRRHQYLKGHKNVPPNFTGTNEGDQDTAEVPSSIGLSRPLSPEQTVGGITAVTHATKYSAATKLSDGQRQSIVEEKNGEISDTTETMEGNGVSVDEPKQYENVEPTLTPKEELMEKLSKCSLCRMQKVFCHHCKHELARYHKRLGGVPKVELQYESNLRQGIIQNLDVLNLIDSMFNEFGTPLDAEMPTKKEKALRETLRNDLHSIVVKFDNLMKSQMQYLRKAEIANVEARDYFKHRNYMVGSVERNVEVHPQLRSIDWTNRILDKVHPWDSKRSGVGLNSVSSSYSARALEARLRRTKGEAHAAAQRAGVELPGTGWHSKPTTKTISTEDEKSSVDERYRLTGKYVGKRTLPKMQSHLAYDRRAAGRPGPKPDFARPGTAPC